MKFYVYCVARNVPKLQSLVGLEQKEVEILASGELMAVASRFENDVVPVSRENVLRHEAVVRRVFSETTVLPFRFGTLITESSLESFLKSRQVDLTERLTKVSDCIEMSVKIIWHNSAELEQNSKTDESTADALPPGTAFLNLKRQQLRGDEKLEREARELARLLNDHLRGVVRQEQMTVEPKQKLVIAASYLVERSRASDYRQALAGLQADRPELHFLMSGPWPPYTFANIDLEFETHFGVS